MIPHNTSHISNISSLSLRFKQGVDDKELAPLQGRICNWFAARGWICAYARFGTNGQLESFQSGDKTYCEWGHYLDSGPYDWHGQLPLSRTINKKTDKAHLFFPSGRETQRWSSYTAIIILPTRAKLQWNTTRGRYTCTWNGKPPQLWWHRERCNRARYERRRALFEARHDYQHIDNLLAFTLSGYIPDNAAASLKVPEGFAVTARETLQEASKLLGVEPVKPQTNMKMTKH